MQNPSYYIKEQLQKIKFEFEFFLFFFHKNGQNGFLSKKYIVKQIICSGISSVFALNQAKKHILNCFRWNLKKFEIEIFFAHFRVTG